MKERSMSGLSKADVFDVFAEVVLYCRGELCRISREAAVWLRERGIDAKAMDEGIIEWRANKDIIFNVA
ncbi:hypothetical protein HMPREF0183_2005 [Brevibacterium mcbrellneri ATCC 49030]|uniref:Rhodanese domain-containing protein n=2 Tax=Brevibacterium TaxID=1696 RepID=D4YPZ5_9MICO|nr:hypothetical protein HMPREF0183_2005 [Brevibacterium mcbrellneri ATCC 49030]